MIPRTWNPIVTEVQIDDDFLILEFCWIEVEEQFFCHWFEFSEEQKVVPRLARDAFDLLSVFNFDCLSNNGPVWHNPISTKYIPNRLSVEVSCLHAFSFGEGPIGHPCDFVTKEREVCSNRKVIHHAVEVIALTTCSHACNEQFITIVSGSEAII